MVQKDNNNRRRFPDREDLYHRMIEEVEDYAILMLDDQGIIINWNKGAEKIKGYTEEEIVGKHFRIFYTPADQAAGLPETVIERAKTQGKAIHEGWRVRKNGTAFWGSIVITAIHDEQNNVIGFTKVTRDLTERKVAEDQILKYTKQLESQNKELQQFAYAAAHDMKEPLRKIQFYYSAIMENEGGVSLDKKRTYLLRSAEAARRMQGLIDDLLAFTKVSEPNEKFEPVDLDALLSDVAAFYQDALESIQGKLTVSPMPTVNGIPFQLHQLFLNLISNAIKYRDPDRRLQIEITATRVDDPNPGNKHYRPRQFVAITVRDNGMGFEPEYEKLIFEMFQRLHGREYSGTGIGLSICKKIMENHGGSITAKGYPGKGATFELYLPA